MKKRKCFFLGVLVILLAIGLVFVGCGDNDDSSTSSGNGGNDNGGNNDGGNNTGGGTEIITFNANGQWGWQTVYESDSLFNGNKITQGEVYTFTYSFKSNVPMDYLQIVLIDNGAQGGSNRWVELSGYNKVKENIAANTVISGTVTITATGTATDTTAPANRLVFQAGTGTASQPTLTFTTLKLESGNNGGNNNGGNNTAVTFSSVTANGSSSQSTTQLTLTFSQAITGLTASDITLSGVSGVSKGTLSGSGTTYTLGINGQTAGGTLTVAVSKSGYTISNSSRTVTIYYYTSSGGGGDTAVTFSSVTANGSSSQSTTQLTLTFSQAITGLSASDITLSGVSVTKGTLSGSGPTYTLGISGQTAGGTLTVAVSKSGYTISNSSRTVTIYYYTSSGGGTTEYRLAQPTFGTCSMTSSSMTINWTLQTTGTTPNGLYAYVAPTNITISVYIAEDGSTPAFWYDLTTTALAGTARSYTLSNYTPWIYYVGGNRRVSLRVTATRNGNTSTQAIMSYWFTGSTGTTGTWVPTY
jgi:hypothetical protein